MVGNGAGTRVSSVGLRSNRGLDWIRGHSDLLASVATTALALAVLVQLVPNAFMYGDAPGYTRQMTEGDHDLWVETIHVGYTLVGHLFTRLLPGDPVYAVNLMSAVFGALCVGLVTSIANKLAGKLSAGIAAALALVCVPEFVLHSVFAELYIVQLAFFLLSTLLLLWDRPIASGLAFAWAFLVTPSTVLALPLIVFWRPDGRFLLKWAVSGSVLALAVLAPNYRDYLWGGARAPQHSSRRSDPAGCRC
jgi:hypothetical protein